MKKLATVAALAATLATPAWAAVKTVTLFVPGMTCPACPITVKKALARVEGVDRVEVNADKRETVVAFDDAKTTVEALRKATADAGYPSRLEH
ncbi:mercuric transport protein periplasmic component [Rhodanobacter thiooxydans]|uniref:Periplasmic mercury ion-binding protein n=1 Tax=Rhodanobacter thiooxydans TaxID=416169 RepID=A0A154QEL4_9GAMM|nr:mercury resistance system periplasmic binding protein MerP [Rhodanobacter thiooxydans]EIL99245.1 mercuric transport protein periplasmic component [Rhodanobacter thiooxydans LCS2]KZC22653.1 mercuric transport protein periplasmic component [Rhodanobacter thiooxydans]MCW0202030.1 mercury resistance system periplasmic binding protein MerP [Rhodanobacter thiooxydans]